MKAVIFAGGRGKRLMPLTASLPKPMVPISGKPLLEWTLDSLREAGIEDVLIVVGYLKGKIMDYFKDGKGMGMRIRYTEQPEPKGTSDALKYAKDFIGDDSRFLLVYGDVVFSKGLPSELLALDSEGRSFLCSWEVGNPENFGVFELEGDRIVRIHEKSRNPPSRRINAGIYLLPNRIFYAIEHTFPSERNEYELTDSIQILIDEGDEFFQHPIRGFWSDVGTIDALNEVQEEFKRCAE